ncbi:unnamed protein product, partial [marine sediment metagenome]
RELHLDVKAFFSTYKRATELADALLFSIGNMEVVDEACRKSPVGKLMPRSLYIHTSALNTLPPALRVYEGCARNYIGEVDDANLVKLSRLEPKVSYLVYPRFEADPHPVLASSLLVPLQTFRVRERDYRSWANPPILHRKETLIPDSHPLWAKFARFTEQEERWDLYEEPHAIGTLEAWESQLRRHGAQIRGHRVVRSRPANLSSTSE